MGLKKTRAQQTYDALLDGFLRLLLWSDKKLVELTSRLLQHRMERDGDAYEYFCTECGHADVIAGELDGRDVQECGACGAFADLREDDEPIIDRRIRSKGLWPDEDEIEWEEDDDDDDEWGAGWDEDDEEEDEEADLPANPNSLWPDEDAPAEDEHPVGTTAVSMKKFYVRRPS